jgi:uncharacterized protein (DUF1800 family)
VRFSSELAEIRFGCGLAPTRAKPQSTADMLASLIATDRMAQQFPIEDYTVFKERIKGVRQLRKQRKTLKNEDEKEALKQVINEMLSQTRKDQGKWFGQVLSRWIHTDQGFRERLTLFWKDHFTAVGKAGIMRQSVQPYVEEVIRPNITGRFSDLLVAAVMHPVMLQFLDQNVSAGPNSPFVKKKERKKAGLNENLAREVLELHTLGVDGPYTQQDVRSLAQLFTGLSIDGKGSFIFARQRVEPGPDTVLGKTYGGGKPALSDIVDALHDIASHPATAQHIAWKLAVHFVSDTPDPELVQALATRFTETDGDLMQVYERLLDHPAAWETRLQNVKPPFDFVASSCRALQIDAETLFEETYRKARYRLIRPMHVMGQDWLRPLGPDGWPEEDIAWITPQGLSARMRWAMAAPRLLGGDLPDPREFVVAALGPYANENVTFAAKAAETKPEAIGLVLSSPAFQRR